MRDQHDKVADKICLDGVMDDSIKSMEKTANYTFQLQSAFESKKINPVVKKYFDPDFKKKH